jgi:hypothetical protein
MNLEIGEPTVRIHWDLASTALPEQLLGHPVELSERLESHQHG